MSDYVASAPEDLFAELFAQVFGIEKAGLLTPQFPFEDIHGNYREIDYVVRTPEQLVAFEIDGLVWHHPDAVPVSKFEDDLLRQNSLIHCGWRVFRWTDRQLVHEAERVKDQLALFLESIPGLLAFDDFLPKQRGAILELRPHQQEALDALATMREEGKSIALLAHAQGAGKTVVAVMDAKRVGGRTLFVAHTQELVSQAYEKLRELWPERSAGLFVGGTRDGSAFNVAGSIQSVVEHLNEFDPAAFDYLVIDEAHHGTAATYGRVLGYFTPKFTLGLTATPDRADNGSVLDRFREYAHRLSLRDAIELGELVPIRCIRVATNIDLSRIRFNRVQYNRRDLEDTVIVPSRDRLIVDTYLAHVSGRKAVAFCVNVRHGEELAALFRAKGVEARSVSGRMKKADRERTLASFKNGDVRVLCACDMLNEGWDCPDIEVLLMARPTLSKVVYLQQIGRGTRKAPGKECAIVFDFVDNAGRYSAPLNLHRVLGERRYRPGAYVLAPEDARAAEDSAVARGERPTAVVDIDVWAKDYEELDLFDWQEQAADMLSIAELEMELSSSEGRVRAAVERGEVRPDHAVPIGDRTYHYFHKDRVDEIRQQLGLPKLNASNIKEQFFSDLRAREMSASYKPVMMLALLDAVDSDGRANLSVLAKRFREFYERRRQSGVAVESAVARMRNVKALSDSEVQQVILQMPFRRFMFKGYLRYDRDLAFVRFEPKLWRRLEREDLEEIRRICSESIEEYYAKLG